MKLEKVNFTTSDKLSLFGLLHTPETPTNEVVIFVHGIHSNCYRRKDDMFAEELCKNNIAYFSFNNRGANTVTKINGRLYGAAYEDITECGHDINAAIAEMREKGYSKIHLLGHSLGSSKVLYWYKNSKKFEINTVGLLSLVDSSNLAKFILGKKYKMTMLYLKKQKLSTLIPQEAFKKVNVLPLSVKTFLRIFDNPETDLVSYDKEKVNVENLNKIKEPLFMRFGTINEYLIDNSSNTASLILENITKNNVDISYIEEADHSYHGKEQKLINEYIEFLKNNR